MIVGTTVVAEVLNDGDVIFYERNSFNLDDCADFIDYFQTNRNFFLATLTLAPSPLTHLEI
jgi:hypothetical protein